MTEAAVEMTRGREGGAVTDSEAVGGDGSTVPRVCDFCGAEGIVAEGVHRELARLLRRREAVVGLCAGCLEARGGAVMDVRTTDGHR